MSLQVTVVDESTRYLNAPAEAEIEKRINQYAMDLLREAGRLEAAVNATGGNPEITSTMIADADLLLRRGFRKPRRSVGLILGKVFNPIGGMCAGMLADGDKLTNPVLLVLFVLLIMLTTTSTVVVVVKE